MPCNQGCGERVIRGRLFARVSLHDILFLNVAASTIERQCSREAAFFHAQEGPMFLGLRSDSTALSHVWLGLPGGCFQSDGGWRNASATARWWSSLGTLRAMWPKRRSVTMLESGGHPDSVLTSAFVIWWVHGLRYIYTSCRFRFVHRWNAKWAVAWLSLSQSVKWRQTYRLSCVSYRLLVGTARIVCPTGSVQR